MQVFICTGCPHRPNQVPVQLEISKRPIGKQLFATEMDSIQCHVVARMVWSPLKWLIGWHPCGVPGPQWHELPTDELIWHWILALSFFHLLLPGITPPTVIEPPFSAKHSAKTSFSIGPSWRNCKWLALTLSCITRWKNQKLLITSKYFGFLVRYDPGHSPPHGFSMLSSSHESCSLRHC